MSRIDRLEADLADAFGGDVAANHHALVDYAREKTELLTAIRSQLGVFNDGDILGAIDALLAREVQS